MENNFEYYDYLNANQSKLGTPPHLDSLFSLNDESDNNYIRTEFDLINIKEFEKNSFDPNTKLLFEEENEELYKNNAEAFHKLFKEPHIKNQPKKNSLFRRKTTKQRNQ